MSVRAPPGAARTTRSTESCPASFFLGDRSGQIRNFDVPAGITEITLVTADGSHTLAFAEPELSDVLLAAPGGPTSVRVDFVEGHVYTIFDPTPGHRQQGMEATIAVGPPVPEK